MGWYPALFFFKVLADEYPTFQVVYIIDRLKNQVDFFSPPSSPSPFQGKGRGGSEPRQEKKQEHEGWIDIPMPREDK
jgi:hypothetical protein